MRRATIVLLSIATLLLAVQAAAAPVRGVVKLPSNYPGRFLLKAAGYWLLPNDVLDVLPPLVDPRTEMVVSVEGQGIIGASLVKPTMRIEDARFQPAALPVAPHAKVTFENKDAIPYRLEPVGRASITPQVLAPGKSVVQVFDTPGTYALRAAEQPHMRAVVFVTGAPVFVQPDSAGIFNLPELRPGSYTLSVWYREKVISTQKLEVKPGAKINADVQLTTLGGKD